MLLQQLANGVMLGSTYALVAIGYSLVFGVLRLLHLAHGEVFMVGAFAGLQIVLWWRRPIRCADRRPFRCGRARYGAGAGSVPADPRARQLAPCADRQQHRRGTGAPGDDDQVLRRRADRISVQISEQSLRSGLHVGERRTTFHSGGGVLHGDAAPVRDADALRHGDAGDCRKPAGREHSRHQRRYT